MTNSKNYLHEVETFFIPYFLLNTKNYTYLLILFCTNRFYLLTKHRKDLIKSFIKQCIISLLDPTTFEIKLIVCITLKVIYLVL